MGCLAFPLLDGLEEGPKVLRRPGAEGVLLDLRIHPIRSREEVLLLQREGELAGGAFHGVELACREILVVHAPEEGEGFKRPLVAERKVMIAGHDLAKSGGPERVEVLTFGFTEEKLATARGERDGFGPHV